MFPRLQITRTYSLSALVLFLTVGSFAPDILTSSCSTWEQDHDSENNMDRSIALWEKNDCLLIDCAIFCNQNLSCMSFFHHFSLQRCLGLRSYKCGLPSGTSIQQGWQYYTKPQHCDGDYVFNQPLGLCYKFHAESKTFNDAMVTCETEGAKLLIIRNQNEIDYIKTVINSQISAVNGVFIGLRAFGVNRIWKWWNGQDASYILWNSGEPNNAAGNENCVFIQNSKCSDDPCNRSKTFLCQRFIK